MGHRVSARRAPPPDNQKKPRAWLAGAKPKEALHRPDGLVATIPRAHKTGQRQQKKPRLAGGARGASNSTWKGGGHAQVRPHLNYARPVGRASGASVE